MDVRTKSKKGPEAKIQEQWIAWFKTRDWIVKATHGNMFQSGFPDLYVAHRTYGARWVEVKNPLAYSFTPAQYEWFPKFMAAGVGVWVLFDCCEAEYQKLFKPANVGYIMFGKQTGCDLS